MPKEKKQLTDGQIREIIVQDLERALGFLSTIRNDQEVMDRIIGVATERYKAKLENEAKQPELEGL